MSDYEQVMSEGWKHISQLLAREYRHGFEAGYFGRYMELKPRACLMRTHKATRQVKSLHAREYALSAAPQQGYEDVTYEEIKKGA